MASAAALGALGALGAPHQFQFHTHLVGAEVAALPEAAAGLEGAAPRPGVMIVGALIVTPLVAPLTWMIEPSFPGLSMRMITTELPPATGTGADRAGTGLGCGRGACRRAVRRERDTALGSREAPARVRAARRTGPAGIATPPVDGRRGSAPRARLIAAWGATAPAPGRAGTGATTEGTGATTSGTGAVTALAPAAGAAASDASPAARTHAHKRCRRCLPVTLTPLYPSTPSRLMHKTARLLRKSGDIYSRWDAIAVTVAL